MKVDHVYFTVSQVSTVGHNIVAAPLSTRGAESTHHCPAAESLSWNVPSSGVKGGGGRSVVSIMGVSMKDDHIVYSAWYQAILHHSLSSLSCDGFGSTQRFITNSTTILNWMENLFTSCVFCWYTSCIEYAMYDIWGVSHVLCLIEPSRRAGPAGLHSACV